MWCGKCAQNGPPFSCFYLPPLLAKDYIHLLTLVAPVITPRPRPLDGSHSGPACEQLCGSSGGGGGGGCDRRCGGVGGGVWQGDHW